MERKEREVPVVESKYHYENLPTQYKKIFFSVEKNEITLEKVYLRSIHNLCFGPKIRKIPVGMPPVLYTKVGFVGVMLS